MKRWERFTSATKFDSRGNLTVLQRGDDFWIGHQRLYFINSGNSLEARGFHAHKKLHQVLLVLAGSFEFTLDDGFINEQFILEEGDGISIKPMVWREFSPQVETSVLAVLASELFSEEDYIRSYSDFLYAVKNN